MLTVSGSVISKVEQNVPGSINRTPNGVFNQTDLGESILVSGVSALKIQGSKQSWWAG